LIATVVSGLRRVSTRSGRHASANLTPASGRQDHTTSPSAATSLVRVLCDRSRAETRPAITSRAKHCRVHRIPPRVRDDHDTPLLWGGMGEVLEVIWGEWERKYFCKWDSTPLSTNGPTGKSLVPWDGLSLRNPSRHKMQLIGIASLHPSYGRTLRVNPVYRDTQESTARTNGGMNSAWVELTGYSLIKEGHHACYSRRYSLQQPAMPGEGRYHE